MQYATKPSKPNLPNQTYKTKPTKPNLPNQPNQTKPTKPNITNQIYPTKSTKPNLPNQTYQTKPTKPRQTYKTKSNLAYQAYWTRPTKTKLLGKAVNARVCSAFGNVLNFFLIPYRPKVKSWRCWKRDVSLSRQSSAEETHDSHDHISLLLFGNNDKNPSSPTKPQITREISTRIDQSTICPI